MFRKHHPSWSTPEKRKHAARWRRIFRPLWVVFAILIALMASLFLVSCGRPKKASPPNHKKPPSPTEGKSDKPVIDQEEHRKGMPVRDFIVE